MEDDLGKWEIDFGNLGVDFGIVEIGRWISGGSILIN